MNSLMPWEPTQAFLAVAEHGTLAAAADALNVNASTVHRRIAALEDHLNRRLFDKTPRGYALTAVGEAALPHALSAQEALLALRRAVIGHDREARGTVRITLPDDLLPVLAPVFADFRAKCPHIQLDIRADTRLMDLGRDTDVALRVTRDPPLDAIAHRLATVRWAVYRHRDAASPGWVHLAGFDQVPAVREHQGEPASAAFIVQRVADAVAMLRRAPLQAWLPVYAGDCTPELERVGEVHTDRKTALWLLIHTDLRRSARVRAFVDDFRRLWEAERV